MMTKGPSRKQVLVSITIVNSNKIMVLSNKHVTHINRMFKDIKSDIIADFIRADYRGFMIITNKVVSISNLNIIEKYKILDIFYLIEDTNISITSNQELSKSLLNLT